MAGSPNLSKAIAFTLALLFSIVSAAAQDGVRDARALRSWIALDAPPGWEHLATDVISKAMPEWRRDALGNLILRKGSGSPRRVIACGLDRPGFAVTEVTDNGFLRLREAGSMRTHPLWVQFYEGQRVRVLTRRGPVAGVVTVKSTHLQRGRAPNAPVTTLDDLWVDVGATSRTDVQRLGIEMLNPVVRDGAAWSYGDFVAGPLAAARVGCAAVASAAAGRVENGETIFLLTTLRSFGYDGLEAALRQLGRVNQVTVVEQSDLAADSIIIVEKKVEKPAYLPESTGLSSIDVLGVKRRYAGSLVESVRVGDANALLTVIARTAGIKDEGSVRWISLPEITSSKPVQADALSNSADLLKSLADIPAVSGHERPVREAIVAALPAWARSRTTTDNEGNLILEVGPERDPVMFIAHQDEVGFEVTNIASDGSVSLRARGGLYQSLWEGQPALLHFDAPGKPALPGVFQPRETATSKQPEALTAWFGVDAAGLKARGVVNGMSVTALKSATRLGATRFTARALDDRAGSTALILAARRMNPATLRHRVIFAWSVREETGLEGAMALARRYGSSVKRVFSVDTFVSSDSPAETTRFAYAPLGEGAVIRGLDNSAVASPAEIERILAIARAQNIPLQVGATNGGTDGSDFVRYGA
ncbi:MAG TPA: M28 family peptidase, partial [Pyrinomonadaceae bacterium]